MILNESGINKVVKYLGEDHCKYVFVNNRHLLLGVFNDSDLSMLEDIGIKLCNIGGGLHEVILEREDIDSVEVEESEENDVIKSDIDDKELKELAKMLIPVLSKIFPTKDEINDIINQLQAQAIDPDEMIDGLKMQIRRIKKQSREHDEVG